MIKLDSKVPAGTLAEKWTNHKFNMKLINPANKRKFDIIVVGTGLAGASAAATLGELGYKVKAFTYHDSSRRAHSIGAQGSRTFYARGETGQQLLLGAYSSLNRQIKLGNVQMFHRREMLDVVIVDGKAKGITVRNLLTGEIESYAAQAVILATGGYMNVYFLSTSAMLCNTTAIWRAHKRGALFANPCFTQIHPTCLPVHGEGQSKLVLMSESLRNDGRIWVSKKAGDHRPPNEIPEDERDYYLERRYPSFGNLAPRDVSSRSAKYVCDEGRGVNGGRAVYLDFADAIKRLGAHVIKEKYGNLFDMYLNIIDEDPYKVPMKIYPAPHYAMGGLWVDYNFMSNISGLFVAGEANFSDHGANRLGASALMQGLADGYFVIPYTIGNYFGSDKPTKADVNSSEFKESKEQVKENTNKLLTINRKQTVDEIHKKLGHLLIDKVGMSRDDAGLRKVIKEITDLRDEFWHDVKVVGKGEELNLTLEKAGRVADFLELSELMAVDALNRDESCGAHFREEHQTEEGEAIRNDKDFAYVAAWEFEKVGKWNLHKENLEFE